MWTLEKIKIWHINTFPLSNYKSQLERFLMEMQEFNNPENSRKELLEEFADLVICNIGLSRFSDEDYENNRVMLIEIATSYGFTHKEIKENINNKMNINKTRKWEINEKGQYER